MHTNMQDYMTNFKVCLSKEMYAKVWQIVGACKTLLKNIIKKILRNIKQKVANINIFIQWSDIMQDFLKIGRELNLKYDEWEKTQK